MNKIKLSKIILIIAIYSVAFTLLFMSIKSYQTYLNTYKSCKSASNTNISSTKKIKNTNCININKFSTTVFNNETIQKNPYKTLSQSNPKIQKNIAGHVLRPVSYTHLDVYKRQVMVSFLFSTVFLCL